MGSRMLKNMEWSILVPALILMVIGLLNLYSVSHIPADMRETFDSQGVTFWQRQAVWVVIGLAAMIFAILVPFRYYEGTAIVVYAFTLILLFVVLLLEPLKGASRWINAGAFRIQPSEFMKAGVVFLLARFLAERKHDPNRFKVILVSILIVAVPFVLVIKQPDLGTALVYLALLFPVLYWRGLSEWVIILLLSPTVSAFLTLYSESALKKGTYPFPLLAFFLVILIFAYRRRHSILQSVVLIAVNLSVMLSVPVLVGGLKLYQQKRIMAFLRPESDILGTGWQVYQSKVAVGSGGFSGKGFLHGTQKLYAFLPERHSDFAFSVFSEEKGFLGAFLVVILFSLIIVRGLFLATKVKNRFASLAIIGICSYFTFHLGVNVGMTIGLAPVTGLPLPFISYGGSSLLLSCFFIGVLLNFGKSFYEY